MSKRASASFFTMLSLLAVLAIIDILLIGCAGPIPDIQSKPTVSLAFEQPIIAEYQPHRTIDVWLDDTSGYPRALFTKAKNALATDIEQAVQLNSDGMVVYLNIITSNSWKPESTLLTIVVPSLPADPPRPRLLAKPTPTGDPFTDGQNAKKVDDANAQMLAHYQRTLKANHTLLSQTRARVHRLTDELRALNPTIDSRGEDLWGMFGRASERLNGGNSVRLLIVVSSLENTTWDQFTPYKMLWGVYVRVLWHYCINAPECGQNDAFWVGAFRHAGAADVHIYDPAQSETLQNVLS